MIFEVGVALIILLIIFRKDFINIAEMELKFPLLLILSFLMQFLVVFLGGKGFEFMIKYGSIIYIISFLLLLWVLWQNMHLKGMKIIFIGIMLNFLAITLNGGTMPVLGSALDSAGLHHFKNVLSQGVYPTHSLMQETNNIIAKILGDYIPITPPHPRPRVISIGDIIMTIGVILLFYFNIKENAKT